MKDLVTELEEQLVSEGYDIGTGWWGVLVEEVVDALWEAGYACDAAKERFGTPVGRESMSSEIRFDEGQDILPKALSTTLMSVLRGVSTSVRQVNIPTKYGRTKVVATMETGNEVIVDLDNVVSTEGPYLTMYLLTPVRTESLQEAKEKGSSIAYTGIVLDEDSQDRLKRMFATKFPDLEGWKTYCHHMSIKVGGLTEKYSEMVTGDDAPLKLGKKVQVIATDTGMNEKVVAVKVNVPDTAVMQAITEVQGKTTTAMGPLHITLATGEGGKPKMAKELTDWKPMDEELRLTGTIQEVPNK